MNEMHQLASVNYHYMPVTKLINERAAAVAATVGKEEDRVDESTQKHFTAIIRHGEREDHVDDKS